MMAKIPADDSRELVPTEPVEMPEIPNSALVKVTGIPNIATLTDKDQDFSKIEKLWTKEIQQSSAKASNWLFRHAMGLAIWRQEIGKRSNEYEGTPQEYWINWVRENLDISPDLANKRRRAGELIRRMRSGIGEDKSEIASRLPISYSALTELASLDDNELKQAQKANILHEEVTIEDIREFKKQLKENKKRLESAQEREHKKHTAKAEAENLTFDYDPGVPEEVIEKIEDMAIQLGAEAVRNSPTMKFHENGSIWVCTLVGDLWSATEIVDPDAPKVEAEQEEKEPAEHVPSQPYVPPPVTLADEQVEQLTFIGINVRKNYIEKWALKALEEAGEAQFNPDKNPKMQNEELYFQFLETLENWRRK